MARALVLFALLGAAGLFAAFPVEDYLPGGIAALGRAGGGSPAAAEDAPVPQCQIKGAIGPKGERLYHVPGSPYYERIQPNPARGDRWFCSKAEALAAGWRPSMR